jgi:hypothetical protein
MNYYTDFDDCQVKVIDSLKKILFTRHNDVFDRIDFYDDSIFLEPLLYTYVSQNDPKWLDCIIYGYERSKKETIEVFSNARGTVYLPQVGYLNTSIYNRQMVLLTRDDKMTLSLSGEEVQYTFEPLLYLAFGIEVLKDQHPLLEKVFIDQGSTEDVVIENVYQTHLESLEKGLKKIKDVNTYHFALLQKSLKKIMLFTSEEQNSFAVLAAHNMIFLNVHSWDDEVFFVDHISHEGAHCTFFTLTYESKSQLFKCHPNDAIGNFLGEPGKHSSIYLYFHGMFTFVEITKSLAGCLDDSTFSPRQGHDVRGRFVFAMERYKLSIDMFDELSYILTPLGLMWLELFRAQYYSLEARFHELNSLYTLINQPYDFNSKIFAQENHRMMDKPIFQSVSQVRGSRHGP